MSAKDLLFGDVAAELDTTRRILEAVPDAHFEWKPHEKSWTIGELSTHISNLPMWASMVLTSDGLDMDSLPPPSAPPPSIAAVLENFDRNRAGLDTAMAGTTGESLAEVWTAHRGEHVIMSGPRAVVFRQAGMTHMGHHRGQLTVYLRLLDVPVPETYGPTADSTAGW